MDNNVISNFYGGSPIAFANWLLRSKLYILTYWDNRRCMTLGYDGHVFRLNAIVNGEITADRLPFDDLVIVQNLTGLDLSDWNLALVHSIRISYA